MWVGGGRRLGGRLIEEVIVGWRREKVEMEER